MTVPGASSAARCGRIRPLAIGRQKRIAHLPEAPASTETLPGFEAASWLGIVAPAGTPPVVLTRVHNEFTAALADTEVAEKLTGQGFQIVASTPLEFLAYVKSASDRRGEVIADNQIKLE